MRSATTVAQAVINGARFTTVDLVLRTCEQKHHSALYTPSQPEFLRKAYAHPRPKLH